MAISTINQNGLNAPLTLTAPVINTVTSAASTALTLQSAGTTAVTIDTSQNVGIGTTSPNQKLEVLKAGGGAIRISETASRYVEINGYGEGTANGSVMAFNTITAGTSTLAERGRFDNAGSFLVGTTTSSSPSTGIALIPSFSTTNASGISISHASNASSGNSYLFFLYNTSGIGSITQSGTTAVLYNTTSDYRLKENVTPIQNALDTVKALNPISFTWIDGRQDDGFLAHELQAVIPNCVTGEKDAVDENDKPIYQQMDNSGVIPFLVKAIQELNAKVDAQAAEIQALKAGK